MADKLVYLDPASIRVSDNARFGLLPFRVQQLKQSILEQGAVNTPVEVEPVAGEKGVYTLTAGFYRHKAVTELNKDGAEMQLPAIVRSTGGDPVARLRRQLSENVDRQNLSPMDTAVAIKKLLDAGVPRADVRQLFARPTGRKGIAMAPASNSWLNITLSFLDFPKDIQTRIHDGRLGVKAAHELTRIPEEKRAAVLERAEANRQTEMDLEEKEEEKFLKQEAKTQEQLAKEEAARKELEDARAAAESAAAAAAAADEAVKGLVTPANYLSLPKAEQKAINDERSGALEAFKAAKAEAEKAKKQLEKVEKKLAPAPSEEAAPAPKAAGKGKGKAVTQDDVLKAAAEEGVNTKPKPLGAKEMGIAIFSLKAAGGRVKMIAEAIEDCFAGLTTQVELKAELVSILNRTEPAEVAPAKTPKKAAKK
jgi:hypothetical protein